MKAIVPCNAKYAVKYIPLDFTKGKVDSNFYFLKM